MRRDQRLDSILAAALRALQRHGMHGTTMREVAREARTSLANLYTYVGGRDELLYRAHLRVLDAAVASALATASVPGPRERLRALVTDHVRRVLAHPAEAEVLRGTPGLLRGERARRVDEQRRRYLQQVQAAADAVAGRVPPAHSDERARLLLGMADRLALDAHGGPGASPERLSSAVLRMFLSGAREAGAGRPQRAASG
ncbi:MAG: TetR/AcrR family transcriptional regulator, partial [Planctomycetia bacterium]